MKLFLLLLSTCISVVGFGKVELPAIINNNMVLQQRSQALLWGTALKKSTVTVVTSWNNKVYKCTAGADGAFSLKVQTPVAGGPYDISFSDGEKLTLKNILIGEVWLCSGQSNMEMPVRGFNNQPILNSNDLLLDADKPGIRLFRVEKDMSARPEKNCKARWEEPNALTVKEFSAIGYQYARLLQDKLGVPVGIILSAYGGTDIEAWMTGKSLEGFTDMRVRTPKDTAKIMKNDPHVLFNAMINPIVGFNIKGVLWYQGENNRFNPATYDKKMAAMVKEWRALWAIGDWPFYYVQIAPYVYTDNRELLPMLREGQDKAMQLIPNSGMVVSVDAGSMKTIHPPDKTIIAKRLACWALANTYNKKGIAFSGPVYRSMQADSSVVTLLFDNAPNGLTAFGKELSSFEVAGADHVFYPAKANITGKGVTVQSDSVKEPVAVRYAFKDWAPGYLYNTEGLPAAPFRTDQ